MVDDVYDDDVDAIPVEGRNAVDYLLRSVQQNMVRMTGFADQKANIVLGASLIMVTIIVGLASNDGLSASLAVLGSFTVVSSVCALLAVMPTTRSTSGQRNPIFFGDIAEMTADEFRRVMTDILHKDERLYATWINDVHRQAVILQHTKFRYLRAAYGSFIVGLVATSVTVIAELVI